MKGFVIAGTGSGVGKTSITTGLLSLLAKKNVVQAYKVGPDFIDPMYHTIATGRQSRNLDSFMMTEEKLRQLVGYTSRDADLCVVEGVRGLFEGLSGRTDECSTAEMAKMLGFPVILVINARSLTRSVAAIVRGFQAFDPDVNIAGVIMNNVSGPQHERKLREAMDEYTDVDIIGIVRRDTDNAIGQRHLGLNTITDSEKEGISFLENMVSDIDTGMLFDIAGSCRQDLPTSSPYTERESAGIRAAVPSDPAYCFYYYENIECMRASGIDVQFFRPTEGDGLPDADVYYLGGGYPELYADQIAENRDFREGLRTASEDGKIVIGECGGLMSLCRNIIPEDGVPRPAIGVFDADARLTKNRHGPSYVIAGTTPENPLFPNMTIRAHEFHYSEIELKGNGSYPFGYDIFRGTGIKDKKDGLVYKNTVGAYMHQHALSTDDWFGPIMEKLSSGK
ncbi:hydrogenobyrinic acid a,c-diamide synthase (glutamine-hydrolyzing) [Methanosarcinaceae archaeon]|nr:hydrogenobyrinic acid a,c-diamide synthase (glutamine-hydrolyzing) [Methanosarcinaceae archaeon]